MKISLNKRTPRGARESDAAPGTERQKSPKAAARLARARYTPTRLRPGKRRISGKEKLIVVIPALAAVLAVGIVLFTVNTASVYKFRDTAFQYYGGSSVRIESGSELRCGTKGTVSLKAGNQTIETTLPIYLENSRRVVLPASLLATERQRWLEVAQRSGAKVE